MTVALSVTPSTFITGQQTFCGQQAAVYSSSPSSATIYNWTVNGGSVQSNNGDNILIQWNIIGTGSIILTAVNAEGCDTTLSYTVDIYPQPSPSVTGPATTCTPSSNSYSLSPSSNNNYSWSVTGGTIAGSAVEDSIQVLWNTTGTGTISLTESNSYGCDTTVTTSVLLNAFPSPDISGNDLLCQLDTATYSVPNVPGHTYDWSVTGGAIVSFTVSNSIDVYWYTPGAGSVRVNQKSLQGCETPDSIRVVVNPPPAPFVTGPLTVCLNDQSNYLSNQQTGSTYVWTVNGGTINGSASQPYAIIQWTNTGQGIISVTETNINGCSASTPFQVLVNPLPNATITGSQVGCVDPYGSTYSATNMNNVFYQWSVNGGNLSGNNGQNHTNVLWNSTGINLINLLTVNTATGCQSNTALQVLVDSMPQPQITSNNFNGCAPLVTVFGSSPSITNYAYQWAFGDGASSQNLTAAHTYISPGSYTVTLIVSNNSGCRDTVASQVNVFNSPVADFNVNVSDDFYPIDQTSFSLQNTSAGGVQYLWSFGDGNTSIAFEPAYQYSGPGTYQITLYVTNAYGCRDSVLTTVEIKVPEDIYVPNAFTPNGDSQNDGFSVSTRNITDLRVSIFDRWGEEVFSSADKDFVWDGSYYGHGVQEGLYVYKITALGFQGQYFDRIGTVSVVR
jgi:gliding motility-associated-like protein